MRASRRLPFLLLALFSACSPIVPDRHQSVVDVPAGWKQVGDTRWHLFVPNDWSPDGTKGPFGEVYRINVPPTESLASFAASPYQGPGPRRDVILTVSRFRDDLDLETATTAYVGAACAPCPRDRRRERYGADLDHMPVILTEVESVDGAIEWDLVAQSACHTYVAKIVVAPERVEELHDAVDHILASLRLTDRSSCPDD